MIWDTVKRSLLAELGQRIDSRADAADRQSLHNLSAAFYGRFPAEDMRERSVENLYGCLYGLLRFLRSWPEAAARIHIFNPEIQSHGWESKYTVVAIICRGIPFCTASVRGELNRRNLTIHGIASSNLPVRRDAAGELEAVLSDEEGQASGLPEEAVLYFEIGRHSNPAELDELRLTLGDILQEVALVVDDFPAMGERLQAVEQQIRASECIELELREEAAAFLAWVQQRHMTLLGYEYLEVADAGQPGQQVNVVAEASLGLLRHRTTRGVEDLAADLEHMSADDLRRRQLSFSKSRQRSRVHRLTYPDYVEIKVFNDAGAVIGQHRLIGLYTSSVYTMSPELIPILRRKVQQVLEQSHFDTSDHESRELVRVLELFPRDELFQSSVQDLYDTVTAVNRIQERRQTRLFVRRDVHGKFVNCMVYIPRDRYTTEQREKIERILCAAFNAEEAEFTTHFSESILVRCHFVLRVDPKVSLEYDASEIENQIVQATLAWEDRLRIRLIEEFGEERGEVFVRELATGFPPGYRDDFDPRVAVLDIKQILRLQQGEALGMTLYRLVEEGGEMLRLRLYHSGASLPLSDVLPILENLGLRVMTERPYGVRAHDGKVYWIQEFTLIYALSHNIVLEEVKQEFEEAFSRIWFGGAENDCFNRLLIGTRLDWRELAMLRAYARYLRQVHFPFSVEYIGETLGHHLQITGSIVELFLTRFSPVFEGDADWRAQREQAVEQRILDALEHVENLGEDRIIRQFVLVIKATLRTNFFQPEADGSLKSYFSFKLRPADIPGIPKPVPLYEIYVYSPRVEGVHLRGGKVARGGLRWSDRFEDFRTEVLGLVKAQQVKNAVIVPVGAKGGFVARQLRPQMSRDEIQQEGIACYQLYIRALLDITDNRSADGVIRPPQVVVKDDEDPYLVVAADKGTASFSDIANAISAEYNFWLGDAFASGGSAGYDHKKMGITARGAWVSVQRHFREIGIDVQSTDFTVVGIGDMAGDVFGNGMLLSEHIRLVAAFNHQHIFIDPEPDAATSFAERKRLFELPRSSWDDYDKSLISPGGGVWSRAAKSIKVPERAREVLGISGDKLAPNELIRQLLTAPVDLVYNGGIGTYVRGRNETDAAVGDRANDPIRITGAELRCKVFGEGGNLGATQVGRIEFALAGGKINTDAIDNSGGVDCSDHEVNIKILLGEAVADGELTGKQRDTLLADMTEEVAALVLRDNYQQTQNLSLTAARSVALLDEQGRFMRRLGNEGRLNRKLEFLPFDEELSERRAAGKGLTSPELAVLLAYSKIELFDQLLDSRLPEDPYISSALVRYFPVPLRERFAEYIQKHPLKREIIATHVVNSMVNRTGATFVSRLREETSAAPDEIVRGYIATRDVFELPLLWRDIEALDNRVPAELQLQMVLEGQRLIQRGTLWFLRHRQHLEDIAATQARFSEAARWLAAELPSTVAERYRNELEEHTARLVEQQVPDALSARVAGLEETYSALDLVEIAEQSGRELDLSARVYFALGGRFDLHWLASQISGLPAESHWQALARAALRDELSSQARDLALAVLCHSPDGIDPDGLIDAWEESRPAQVARCRQVLEDLRNARGIDIAMMSVALRELRALT